jgi:Alpha galactosidase A/Alpha galactosidase C-terminal beta sandwich domain/NPCBM-associated, NEW3 domain of alpha-galactosidase
MVFAPVRRETMNRLLRAGLAAVLISPMITAAAVAAAPAAVAEANGVGQTPAMGWSSWSYIRHDPTAADIEAQAAAMKSSGLASAGYDYVNIDDFWYGCPGSQGPDVDQYGRWATNSTAFPPGPNGENGIKVVADYVHSLGLKFGIYATPGISDQAVAQNTPIQGTAYTADEIANGASEANYNCGGMQGIDYSKPGAQAFIDSWANEFASWGVDYLKLDGVGDTDIGDVSAWSQALQQTGRPIHFELSNSLDIANAATWAKYSNGWRTGGDVECYCGANGSSYPLTDWGNVSSRFDQVAAWQPYGGPGAYNDYDSLEIGNGSNDGLTPDERQSQMSLWALGSSPLLLGTDLTHLDPTDLSYLKNTAVIAVDQDGIDASRVVNTTTQQVFAKTEKNGDVIVGLFNASNQPEIVSTSAASVGLTTGLGSYLDLDNLWTGKSTESTGAISAAVAPHGVALFKVTKTRLPIAAPPSAAAAVDGVTTLSANQPATLTVTLTDNGPLPLLDAKLDLTLGAADGWTVKSTSPNSFPIVGSGRTVHATYQVTAPQSTQVFGTASATMQDSYTWPGAAAPHRDSATYALSSASPVQSPYQTYSSATDATAVYSQVGQQFGIQGAGPDLWTGSDAYSTIYQPGVVSTNSTIETEVTGQANMSGYAKAGIIVRNSITGSGSTPEGVILYESPADGFQIGWDDNGGTVIDNQAPGINALPISLPAWLKLVRSGSTYTGYYSTDGSTWTLVGSVTAPAQNTTQDAGMFVTSHATGQLGTVDFDGFSVG